MRAVGLDDDSKIAVCPTVKMDDGREAMEDVELRRRRRKLSLEVAGRG